MANIKKENNNIKYIIFDYIDSNWIKPSSLY